MQQPPQRPPGEGQDSDGDPADGQVRAELARVHGALAEAELQLALDRERAALLRGEIQHRVRNVLAVVRSIFARSVAAGGSLDEVADHFTGRLDVIARLQGSRDPDPGGAFDLEGLVHDELQMVQAGDDPRVTVAGPELRLAFDAAQAIGLALHELATNAVKFGVFASDDPRARLAIAWRVEDQGLAFEWRESGVAVLAAAPLRLGFGREYVEQALPYQFGATTDFALKPGGLHCTLRLPLEKAQGGAFGTNVRWPRDG